LDETFKKDRTSLNYMNKTTLIELGFSEGEADIYIALLKLGSASIMQLAKKSGRHRTHIYDTIEKLKEKGLVSESIVDNKKKIVPSNPDNIIDYLKEREKKAESILPELKKLQKTHGDIIVETFKGKAGLRSVLRDIHREKKDYIGYGEGSRFGKVLPTFYEYFREESGRLGLSLRLILKNGVKVPKRKKLQVRYIDYVSPSTTFIYANKVLTIIWEPFPTAIRITDDQVAKSYKNYFEIMWKSAKK